MSSERRNSIFASLRFRLTLAYAIAFSVGLAVVFGFLSFLLHRTAVWQTDAMLESEARRLLDLAARRKPRIMQAEVDRFAQHHGTESVFLALHAPDGECLATSDPAPWPGVSDEPPSPSRPDTPRFQHEADGGGRHVRTVILTAAEGHTVRLSRSLEGFERELHRSGQALFIAFTASLLLGTGIAFALTHHAMARMEGVRRTAAAIAEGDLNRRVPPSKGGDEVAALTATFNRMLDKLAAAFDELRTVTDSMAHDVRTPLTRMRGAAEAALLSADVPAAAADALGLVVEESDRLERMTSTLLQVVRMDAGACTPAREPLSLRSLVQDAVELLEPTAEDKRIALQLVPIKDPLPVSGDRSLLERVLANLLDNAIKYTPAGGRITVSCRQEANRARLTVTDTGPGIAPDELPHVFDRFYRADSSRSAAGWGLGLSFVQAAVRVHDGRVSVTSRPGEGTTFDVRLPLVGDA